MIILNSIKKISFLIFFLCVFFVLPSLVNAVESSPFDNMKQSNIGSVYDTEKTDFITGKITTTSDTLFSANPANPKLTAEEFEGLKVKLEAAGSPLADKITIDNVSRRNSANVSTFVYDPTMNDATNGDYLNLGYATRKNEQGVGGNFYTALKPVDTESTEAKEQLNAIDVAQGRAEGTSLAQQNDWANLIKEEALLQQKINEQQQIVDAKQTQYNTAVSTGDQQAILAAQAGLEAAKYELGIKQNSLGVNNNQQLYYQQQANAYNQSLQEGRCEWSSSISNCILWGGAIGANIIFKLASFGAYMAGTLFDYSLEMSVNSAEFIKKLGVVEITWTFIRDILNMTFIFILLFTAVQILIGNDEKYNARKILTNVVVFAILMNFSLFAAKIMVDGSNVVSLKIYEAMKSSAVDGTSSISIRVMNTVGLTALYNVSQIFTPQTLQVGDTCKNNPTSIITVSVLGTIFLIILILALGLAAILFLIRLVNIIFLFIRSPLWIWGYTIPGNSTMNNISANWWKEMKHVLLFPIMYLFQILIAIIVFDKLGSVQREGGANLLSLICNPPVGTSGFGSSISVVAIFALVIMFLMRAISYGVKNATGGGDGALGNKIASNMSNKFANAQKFMTTGLAKKAGGMSVGAANRGIMFAGNTAKRAGGGLVGGAAGLVNGDGFRKGAAEGLVNPGIYTKEQIAKMTGKMAMATGSQTLARKAVGMSDAAEKSRKEVYEARTKDAKETEGNLQKIAAEQYKIQTQEQWEKKNGKIGADATKASQYKEYVEKQIEKRANVALGKGIIHENNKDGVKHLDALKAKAISQEEIKDASGAITGYKIKVSNREVETNFEKVFDYHTTGEGATTRAINKKSSWNPVFRTKRAEAKFKAVKKSFKESASKYSGEQAEKDLAEMIKKVETKLSHMPSDSDIDKMVTNLSLTEITGEAEKLSKEVRDLNRAKTKYLDAISTGASPSTLSDLKEKLEDKAEAVKSYTEKATRELIKRKEELKRKEDKAKENN